MELNNLNKSRAEVYTEAAAQTLIDPKKRRYLEPFMDNEMSASRAAELLGVKLTAMLYQLKRLQALGLLELIEERSRRGKAMKIYRATASKFFVPFELTQAESLTKLLTELEGDLQRYFVQNIIWAGSTLAENWGFMVYRTEKGVVHDLVPQKRQNEDALALLLKDDSPALWSSAAFLSLDFETAKALQKDLSSLLRTYRAKQVQGQQTHLVKLGLTPVKAESFD